MGRIRSALRRLERRILRAFMGAVAAVADRRVGRHLHEASRDAESDPDSR